MIKALTIDDENNFFELGMLLNDNFKNLYNLNDILNNDYSYIYGYYIDNVLVAFLHITKSFETIDIINIVVNENYRNKGIASNLLNHMFNSFNDVNKYLLEVKVTNTSAINLYKKNGFNIISTREKYYEGIDGYLMGKEV